MTTKQEDFSPEVLEAVIFVLQESQKRAVYVRNCNWSHEPPELEEIAEAQQKVCDFFGLTTTEVLE